MEYWYKVCVESADHRPQAGERLGLEVARALHQSMEVAGIWRVKEVMSSGLQNTEEALTKINYDPKRTVDQQL